MSMPVSTRAPAGRVKRALPGVVAWLTSSRFTWCLFSVLVLLVWGPKLFRSFWVDEAGTFWMAHQGLTAAIQNTWHWPGQSVLYSAIASLFCLSGGPMREFVLRIPTVLGMAVAAYFTFRLAERAIGRGAGTLAVVILAFHPSAVSLGTQARPYGLAMAAVAASTWFLYGWVDKRDYGNLFSYVAATTLILYLHYFFGIVILAHLIYLSYVFLWERRAARWFGILMAFPVIALLIAPLWPHLRLLFHEAHTLPFAAKPTVFELTEFVLSPLIVFGLFVAALIVQGMLPSALRMPTALKRSFVVLALAWWLLGPLLLFGLSLFTSMRAFVPRYLAYSVLAQATLLAFAGWSVFNTGAARAWVMLSVLLSTASPLSLAGSRSMGQEELAPFLGIIRQESAKNVDLPPVFFSSPLPESNFYDWRGGISKTYLFAAFTAYPIPNTVLPLPYRLTDDVKQHVSEVIRTQLAHTPTVMFVTHQQDSVPWMSRQMEQAGFEEHIDQPNAYTVVTYRRPPRWGPY